MSKTEAKLLELKTTLDAWVHRYNTEDFILSDPIQIPHRFTRKEDIEIASFFTASFAWGQRKTIINKSDLLMQMMGQEPFQFVMDASPKEIQALSEFKHRTFNSIDLQGFIAVLRDLYQHDSGLMAFFQDENNVVRSGLIRLHHYFTTHASFAHRSAKHISNPNKNSACKRLNMMLRWLVRKDDKGVDFGLWSHIPMSELIIPLDVHVHRTALEWGLTSSKQANWKTAEEITNSLKLLNPDDPTIYDFALFAHAASKV